MEVENFFLLKSFNATELSQIFVNSENCISALYVPLVFIILAIRTIRELQISSKYDFSNKAWKFNSCLVIIVTTFLIVRMSSD